MPSLNIRNINVEFPFEPYPCQVDYMDKVIEALLTGNNALLESPTGTGKTVCLLCATLAWQTNEKRLKSNKLNIGYNLPSQPNFNSSLSPNGLSKVIIYASRTHSQITQVINELRGTGYNPKMTVMASREQLCVNERISKTLKGGALNHACNKLTAQRSCMFKNNLENYSGNSENISGGTSALDIENLVSLGHQDAICPYFYSRENATKSELVLLPYNYLIDASIRSTLRGVDWQDACIIIDEAHNLEQVASDASSFTLTTVDIATCIHEMQNVIRLLQIQDAILSSSNDSSDKNKQQNKDPTNVNNLGNNRGYSDKPNLQQCAIILRSLFNLEEEIAKLEILSQKSGPVTMTDGSKCLVLPGHWLITKLEEIGLPVSTCVRTCDEIRLASDFLLDDINTSMGGAKTGSIQEPKLAHLGQCLAKVYKGRDLNECIRQASDYSVFIKEETIKSSGIGAINNSNNGKGKRVINYWCFSPGVAMEELKRLGVRSILLTSGTLSPMEAFKEDLKIPFKIVLENPHVISENQVWISAISNGPNNKQLNSSYERRDTIEYKNELGLSILNICRSMKGLQTTQPIIHLSGGVLVFFPSYSTLESSVNYWKTNGLWEEISMAIGQIVIENRGAEKVSNPNQKSFNTRGENYERTNFLSSNTSRQMGTIEEFESALQRRGTCMLLAVCRGKVSEGIDFRDSKGRIVIITGIPFAPHMDPWIVLKKQHLDETIQSKGTLQTSVEYSPQVQAQKMLSGTSSTVFSSSTSSSSSSSNNTSNGHNSSQSRLSGQGWYIQSASRAVNQAMGRVIRHKKDWGVIFLLDSRFQADRQISQLSRWLRPRLKKCNNFYTAIQSFRQFSLSALTNPELTISNNKTNQEKVRESRIVPAQFRQNNEKKPLNISKEVIINASDLLKNDNTTGSNNVVNENDNEEDGLNGYIDPSLLLSQNTYEKKYSSGFELKTSTISNYNSELQGVTSENDISVILSQVKSIPSNSKLTGSTSSMISNLNNRSIAHVFSKSGDEVIQSTKPTNRTNNSLNRLTMNSESTLSEKLRNNYSTNLATKNIPPSKFDYKKTVGLQSSDIFSSSQLDNSNNNNNNNNVNNNKVSNQQQSNSLTQSGIRSFISRKSDSLSQSQLSQSQSQSQSNNDNNSNLSSKDLFKQKMAQLQSEVSEQCYNQLRIELKKFASLSKQNEEINPGHIRQFVNSLIQIFSNEVSPSQLHKPMEVFSILVPDNYRELYNTSSNKSIQFISASSSSSSSSSSNSSLNSSLNSTSSGTKKRLSQDSTLSQTINLSQESKKSLSSSTTSSTSLLPPSSVLSNELFAQESRASKRAKMMQSTATSTTNTSSSTSSSTSTSSTRSTIKSLLSTVDSIKLSKDISNNSIQNNQQDKLKKIMCIICKESPPKIACVSSCGHICCESCWDEWLKVKLACPMCRVPTTRSDIARIRVAS